MFICSNLTGGGIYDFSAQAQNGSEVSLSDYKGKALLIVSIATRCSFTPQYDELQNLHDEFKDKGFEMLNFPCNQFGEQAPGNDKEIHSFCTIPYGISIPQFAGCIRLEAQEAMQLYSLLYKVLGSLNKK